MASASNPASAPQPQIQFSASELSQLRDSLNDGKANWVANADTYDRRALFADEEALALVKEANLQPHHRVLDIGRGTGHLALLCQKVMGNTGFVVGLDASPDMIRVAKSKVPPSQPAKPIFIEMNCADNDVVSKIRGFGGPGFDFILMKRFLGYLPDSPVIHGKLLHMLGQFLRPGGCFLVEMADRLKRLPDRFAAKDYVTGEWVSFQVGDQKVVERFHVLPNNAAELTSKYIKHRVDLMNQAVPSCRPLKSKGIYTIFSKKVVEEAGNPAYHSRRTQWESQAREELQAKGGSPSQAEVDELVANRLLRTYGPSLIDRCKQQRGQFVSWDSAPHMMICRLGRD